MEERERVMWFGQEGCRGVCCVNLMKNGGLYIGKGGGKVSAILVGLGGKLVLNFEGRWSL